MSTHGPIQRLVSHMEYAVKMVNSIIKDMDLDECGKHATEDLGVSGLFDLAGVSISRVYFPFLFCFYFILLKLSSSCSNGKDVRPRKGWSVSIVSVWNMK